MPYSVMTRSQRERPWLPNVRDGCGPVTGDGETNFSGGFFPTEPS